MRGYCFRLTMLPPGHEEGLDENGESYFVNVETGTVTSVRPVRYWHMTATSIVLAQIRSSKL